MEICDVKLCSGCGLCVNICPVQAIQMKPDKYFGHKRPEINKSKCIECKVCQKKCPNNQEVDVKPIKKTYAAWMIDDEKHYSSSSGGIASAIYETYLNNGGWIVGVYNDENFEPQFKLTNSRNCIQSFKGSKYVQPCTNDIYSRVLTKLKEGIMIAFIGLPCHCAAMKKIAEGYDDNLLLVDLICHGVPSYITFKSHISYIENKFGRKTKCVKFRDRVCGEKLSFSDNNGVFYSRSLHEDVFMHAFIKEDILADGCYNCKYASPKRVGDLTIGDFWGLGKTVPFNYDVDRVSAVLVNDEKGQLAFDSIKDILFFERRTNEEAIFGNDKLRKPAIKGGNRDYFLSIECIESGLIDKYGKLSYYNFMKRMVKNAIKFLLKKS